MMFKLFIRILHKLQTIMGPEITFWPPYASDIIKKIIFMDKSAIGKDLR